MGQYYQTANISKKEFMTNHDAGAKLMETAWLRNTHIGGELVGLLLDHESVKSLKDSTKKLTDKNFPWGSWNHDIVVRVGDYWTYDKDLDSNPVILNEVINLPTVNNEQVSLYKLCTSDEYKEAFHKHKISEFMYKEINPKTKAYKKSKWSNSPFEFAESLSKSKLFNNSLILLNYTTKEFLSMKAYTNQKNISYDGWTIHPLPLLIALGCEGDYIDNNDKFVGSWAGCEIGATTKIKIKELLEEGWKEILPFFKEDWMELNTISTEQLPE